MAYLKSFGLMILALGMAMAVPAGAQTPPQAAPAVQPALKAPAPAPAATEADVTAGYILGPDDTIEVDVLGQPEFKTRARIRANGTIALPFLGDVSPNGKTAIAFAADVGAKLRAGGYYAKPIVNVEIVSFSSRYVVVLGDVAQPGLQPVDREYRVSEVIARAGGIRDSAADHVVVRRQTGEELKLPFRDLATGTEAQDPVVRAGDKIFVPAAEIFYVYGQVNAPGAYPIKDDMTLRKALARAGGLTPNGSEKRVKVYHDGVAQKADLERAVAPGDVLVVGERLF